MPHTTKKMYLFSPVIDFLLLGGGSLIVLLCLKLIFNGAELALSFTATLFLANIINHPHFAHSYQIFYRNFNKKIVEYPLNLRLRYIFSGIIVPLALLFYFVASIYFQSLLALGLAANLMFFLVGWHYVKQGYGMAMVDAALKQRFYSEYEKKCLLHNAYAVWGLAYLLVNYSMGMVNSKYYGIEYFVFPVSEAILLASIGICIFTALKAYVALRKKIIEKNKIAWNGLLAYGVSLYAWLLIRDPLVLLWIPFFHSLQYMAVVWRYELNRNRSMVSRVRPSLKFVFFGVIGFGLGYAGFWFFPEWLNANVSYAKDIFGDYLFLYIFWIFINVHHYALDTVMWRRGNPDIQSHLFNRQ
ncbi:hypothetical protein [uncultured Oxalicibacterium sp.]|uniref:hypothetical protein n=1 Tax=uncultured Oxalicibacterium sp. TaxID=1168540 RepID=UPI0025F98F83|nr:hypothetical protein [uncultured Oxalicibacterium sp.]